jgi:diguanylate cyclase (GGDEF)-like protein
MRFSEELIETTQNKEFSRILFIALSALPLCLVTALLPRDVPVKWGWVAVAMAIALADFAKLHFDGMFNKATRRSVPGWELALQLTALTVAAGIAVYAGSGSLGIYRELLAILIVYWALWSDASTLVYGTTSAIVALGAATYAQGVSVAVVGTVMVEYGICWGATGIVIYMLVSRIKRTRQQSQRFTDTAGALSQLASIAARSRDLDSAVWSCVGLVGKMLSAQRAAVFAVGADGRVSSLARWASSWKYEDDIDSDDPELMAAARSGVPRLRASTAMLPFGEFEGFSLVCVVDGCTEIERDTDEGTVSSLTTVLTNMIERVSFVSALEILARTDPLTGLANRRSLNERLEHDVEVARRTNASLCVVLIDLDHFKTFNDTYGHIAGDGLLEAVAHAFAERARVADTVARWGGEEFCVSLPETAIANAVRLINDQRRIVHDLRSDTPITFSAGIAQWDGTESVQALIARADAALYGAKVHGRDRVESAQAAAGHTTRL